MELITFVLQLFLDHIFRLSSPTHCWDDTGSTKSSKMILVIQEILEFDDLENTMNKEMCEK